MKTQIVLHSFDALSFDVLPVAVAAKSAESGTPAISQMASIPARLVAQRFEPAMNEQSAQQNKRRMPVKSWLAVLIVASLGIRSYADGPISTNAGAAPVYNSSDASGKFGAGLIIGEPTGVSLKYFFNDTMAIDGGVGWSFHDETDLHIHSDILWHKFDLVSLSEGQLPFYIGVGMRVKFRENAEDRIGVRVPVGVSYMFDDLPLDVFFEVAPIIDFTPSTRGGFTAGIGARWWF